MFKQLELGALVVDPITQDVNDTDLYTLKDGFLDTGELWLQTQLELTQWSTLLNATGGALKPEKCFWYMLDYTCKDGEWYYAEMTPRELFVTNPDGTKNQINQEEVTVSKKTLGIHDSTAGGNEEHLKYIQQKASTWTDRMTNGRLPHHMAWIAYRLQLWPGLRYGLGTMTNDIEEATSVNTKTNYRMLNILGVDRTVTKGIRMLHTTFGGFGLLSVATEQLIYVESTCCYNTTTLPLTLAKNLMHPRQMGIPSTTFLGQDVVEVATPLQHSSAHGMCNNSKSQGKRPGRNGTDPWKGPRQKNNKEFEQMPRVIRNNIPIRHDDSRWSISGAVCVRSR